MKKLLMIATGGTIASSPSENGLIPTVTPDEFLNYIPEIKDFAQIETIQPVNLDSSNVQPEDWLIMAKTVQENYHNYDGFVITHGTDTLCYSACALSYLIQNPDKPVIITGAMHPIGATVSDANQNILDSVRLASTDGVSGVYIVFGGYALIGTRGSKTSNTEFTSFKSYNYPPAAVMNNTILHYHTKKTPSDKLKFYNTLHTSVGLLKLSPGMDTEILDYMTDHYDAVVIESYGCGGMPFTGKRNFLEMLEKVSKKGKTIVITTQVPIGGSDLSIYEVGQKSLKIPGVLQGYDMSVEAIVVKLMWILAQSREFSFVRDKLYTPVNLDISEALIK